MIVSGSINYTTSGRKRKPTKRVKKASHQPKAEGVGPSPRALASLPTPYRRETIDYPSQPMMGIASNPDTSYKKEVSKQYTLAPAYNKGAYQVIPLDNIKHIGK
jgi:hypothetical protein